MAPHAAQATNVSDQRPLFLEPRARNSKCFPRAVDRARQAFLFLWFHRGKRRGARMPGCPQEVPPSGPGPGASMISARPVTAAMGMPR